MIITAMKILLNSCKFIAYIFSLIKKATRSSWQYIYHSLNQYFIYSVKIKHLGKLVREMGEFLSYTVYIKTPCFTAVDKTSCKVIAFGCHDNDSSSLNIFQRVHSNQQFSGALFKLAKWFSRRLSF